NFERHRQFESLVEGHPSGRRAEPWASDRFEQPFVRFADDRRRLNSTVRGQRLGPRRRYPHLHVARERRRRRREYERVQLLWDPGWLRRECHGLRRLALREPRVDRDRRTRGWRSLAAVLRHTAVRNSPGHHLTRN